MKRIDVLQICIGTPNWYQCSCGRRIEAANLRELADSIKLHWENSFICLDVAEVYAR